MSDSTSLSSSSIILKEHENFERPVFCDILGADHQSFIQRVLHPGIALSLPSVIG